MNKKKIGIVGVGMVGGALYNYLSDAIPYDIVKYPDNKQKISEADIIFICVPTPHNDTGHDLSFVREAIENIKGEKIIIIKSTVLPETTDKLQVEYSQHKFLFNPEFLVEKTAQEDFNNPDRQIIGYTKASQDLAESILAILPRAPYQKVMPSTEAELVKYFCNTFLATKVVFANQIYDLAQKLKVDYDTVREAAAADERIGSSHLDIFYEGFRGYGGKCFPKDVRSLIQIAEELGVDSKLWKVVEEINNKLIANNK